MNVTAVPMAKATEPFAGIVNVRALASVEGCSIALPESASTSVYAALWLLTGMFK